jgi:hypothetical protein
MVMGRVLLIIGVVLLLVGIGGAVGASLFMRPLALAPDPASLCQPGERLVEEGGPSTYAPGQGNRRAARMFCVDDKGARREVTGAFVQGLIGQVFGSLGTLGSIVVAILFSLLAALGLVLTLIGAIVSARRARRSGSLPPGVMVVRPGSVGGATTGAAADPASGGDLADRLRQLGEARGANLISQAEHDRLRDEILRAMRTS